MKQPPLPAAAGDLLEELRRLRSRLAKEAGIPSYMIFSNATLEHMARSKPTTMEALLQVNGVGTAKAHRYGSRFLEVIRSRV